MAQFIASVIVSNRLWGCAFIGVSFVAEFAVLFLLPATTTGPLGPINNRIYGTFFSALMLVIAVLGFLGYRAEGEFTLEGDKLVLEATRSSGFSVRPNPTMRLSMKKVWKKGSEVRVDCGWNQLRISFQDEAETEAFVSASDRLLRSGGRDGA